MTWIYKPKSASSPDTLGLHSDSGSPASMPAPSVTSSENPTASLYYKHISPADVSTTPPYGTTSKPLTDIPGEEQTSLLLDSPASHTVRPVKEPALVTTETYGPIHSGSLAKWSPDTSCWRTYQVSMWAMLDGHLMGEPWSDNFPNWGTMRSGELIPLPMPGHLISGADGGYWGTPTVNDSKNNAGESQSKRHGPSLNVQAGQWPTPMASDAIGNRTSKGKDRPDEGGLLQAAKMWPTPKSSRSGPDYAREGRAGSGGDDLATFVAKEEHTWPTPSSASQGMGGTTGRFNKMQQLTDEGVITEEERRTMVQGSGGALSADWVEWLMGVPQGGVSQRHAQTTTLGCKLLLQPRIGSKNKDFHAPSWVKRTGLAG